MVRLILILTLISNLAFAQNAVHLNKNDPAPFDGNLLTEDTTKQLYNDSLEKTSLQTQLDLTNKNVNLLTQDKTLLQTQNAALLQAANSEAHISDLEKAGYFVLGILVTGLAIKGAASIRP